MQIRFPLQTNQTLQEGFAFRCTVSAFLDLGARIFLASRSRCIKTDRQTDKSLCYHANQHWSSKNKDERTTKPTAHKSWTTMSVCLKSDRPIVIYYHIYLLYARSDAAPMTSSVTPWSSTNCTRPLAISSLAMMILLAFTYGSFWNSSENSDVISSSRLNWT